jgi:hypothetical protein
VRDKSEEVRKPEGLAIEWPPHLLAEPLLRLYRESSRFAHVIFPRELAETRRERWQMMR